MDEKPKAQTWNMDEADKASDTQLEEIKQMQAIKSAQSQMGTAMAKEKADEADMKEQYQQMAYSNPEWMNPNEPLLSTSIAASTFEIKPRKRWQKLSDKWVIAVFVISATGALLALLYLFARR